MNDFEKIINSTYSNLALFYRDTEVSAELIAQYKVGQLIIEPLPIFLSSKAGGLTKSVRFLVMSNKAHEAVPAGNENRYGVFVLPPFSCFKVIDSYNLDGQTQIALLRFDFGYAEAFYGVQTSVENDLVEKARKDFEQKVDADLLLEMEEDQWKQASSTPIGVDSEGRFNLMPPLQEKFREQLLGLNKENTEASPKLLEFEASGAIEEFYDQMLNKLSFFWRDTNLSPDKIGKYKAGQLLVERAFTDMSYINSGITKNLRYTIASSSAVDMGRVNPDVAKYGFVLLQNMSVFKVLDVYTVGDKTQVLLLNFPTYGAAIMRVAATNVEDDIIQQARRIFDEQLKMEPVPALQEPEWTNRTTFPIGMDDNGNLFL